jgi:hypothetical protein
MVIVFALAMDFYFARHRYHIGCATYLFGHRFVLGVLMGDPARHFLGAFHMIQQLAQHGPQPVCSLFSHRVAAPNDQQK